MRIENVKLACFSPTGTTRAVAEAIAAGLAPRSVEPIDLTRPATRQLPLLTAADELLLVAVPVYMGRVPALLDEWLHAIRAQQTPTVCVVVYGNRVYDNALLELTDIVRSRGGIPVAGAAFIGEHSFSTAAIPVAPGRPNEDDLGRAREFGRQIRAKLESVATTAAADGVQVPGARPYGGVTTLWDVDFIAVGDQCTQCGLCAEVCPMGAVDPDDSALVDQAKCITCCACIKSCPQGARTMKPGPVRDAAIRLNALYGEPKQPQCFL